MEEVTEEQAAMLAIPFEPRPVEDFPPLPTAPTAATTTSTTTLDGSAKPKKKVPCRVVKPQLHGEGMNAFVTYEVQTKGHSVVRRYSDFLWLHERLQEQFLDVLIPPVPEKVIINRFSREVVEYRRRQLEKFLRRVMSSTVLKTSQFLAPFLTATDSEMPKHRASKFVNPKSQEKSLFEVAGSFFGGLTGKVEPAQEPDPYFDEQKAYLVGLNARLSTLQGLNEQRLEIRKELVEAVLILSQTTHQVSSVENSQDKVLGGFWATLSRILKSISTLQLEFVSAETKVFDDALKDYVLITEAGQKLLQNRWNLVERVHEAKTKNSGNFNALSEDLKQSSVKVKDEIETFKDNKTRDMTDALAATVVANIEHQQKTVALWKELLSELEDYSD